MHFGLRCRSDAALIFRQGALRLYGFRLHARKGIKDFAKTFREHNLPAYLRGSSDLALDSLHFLIIALSLRGTECRAHAINPLA